MNRQWKIHKFGGSSLGDAECFRRVGRLMLEAEDPCVGVVVSAMGGMTDALLHLVTLAERDDHGFDAELALIGERYSSTAKALVEGEALIELLDVWAQDVEDIKDVLKAIALVKSAAQRSRDVVSGYGEIWSARLLAAHLGQVAPGRGGRWIDAREVITVSTTELGPTVLWDVSQRKFAELAQPDDDFVTVITGFIAADEEGLQTTLGRNGSDYSAAIFASLSDAAALSIWTDVDGVMSADPNRVPEARVINELTYNEAMELAYFGAKVIHPQTLGPVVEKGIPVTIRNSFNAAHPGSLIRANGSPASTEDIKGITAIGGMALVNLEGSGMIGVPGTADRLFAALKNAGVSVTLISQASSEHSICIAVPEAVAERAHRVVTEAFADELGSGQIQSVDVTSTQSIVAVVGDGMTGVPGVAARFFGTLGRAGINVRAIAQGSSERNISAVVDAQESTRALRAAHSGFYLSSKTVSIGLIGPGTVGATLLAQIEAQAAGLAERFNLDLRVRAIARSKGMLLGQRRLELADWQDQYAANHEPLDFDAFEAHINPDHLPHAVVIDCTADESIANRYAGWLDRGIHVITPNKRAFSGSIEDYRSLQLKGGLGSSHCFYETTVGAGLPIIATLRDLIDTGDIVHSVEGIFSGTLAYLFNVYDGSRPFSAMVREARDSGYTEPDPRDDLSGMDVARKMTILARELGLEVGPDDIPIDSLVPQALEDVSIEEFLGGLADYDDAMLERYNAASEAGQALRFIGKLSASGEVAVGLEAVGPEHAFSHINLTDNIVQFKTDRYADNPLVVQGPGAGPEVTAAGVFADLLRLAKYLDSDD